MRPLLPALAAEEAKILEAQNRTGGQAFELLI